MGLGSLIWTLKILAWGFLLLNVIRLKLFAKYPLVLSFVFVSMFFEAVMPFAASRLGITSPLYAGIYVFHGLVTATLSAAVLIWIYSVFGALSLKRDWILAVGSALAASLVFSDDREIWTFAKVLNASALVVTFLGVAAIVRSIRCRTMNLGWNLRMVLFALTVPFVFQSLIFMVYTVGFPLSYEALRLWLGATSLAAWIVLAVGMSEYSPPRTLRSSAAQPSSGPGGTRERSPLENQSKMKGLPC